MGRGLIGVVVIALLLGALYVLVQGIRFLQKRSRQRQLAKYAPDLLRFEDLDPNVASLIIEQRKQLRLGATVVSQMLQDPVFAVPSEYAIPLEQWLETNLPKEIA